MRFVSIGECMLEMSAADGDLWRMGIAGDTLNTAWYARACLPSDWAVSYATCIGTDDISQRIKPFLANNGLETDRLLTHPTRTVGLYMISLSDGERSFTYWRDASAARTLADDADRLLALTAQAEVLHVSGITLAILPPAGREVLINVLRQRKTQGVTVSFDPNYRPRLWQDHQIAADILTRTAAVSSVILPSFDDEHALFGDTTPADTVDRYVTHGARTVVVKNGGSDISTFHGGHKKEFDGFTPVSPVDTTGAGDSFNGAFLATLATGQTLEEAVAQGHKVASRVICHQGALMPMETLQQTLA